MVLDIIKQRRSVRNFTKDPITDEQIKKIIEAAQCAPTANNMRGIEYIVVRNPQTLEEIYFVSEPKQAFIKEAPVLLIPIVNTKKSILPVQDLSLASQNIFLQATAMGLGSVWKNFRPPIAKKVQQILEVPEEYQLINAIPIGVPEIAPKAYDHSNFNPDRIHHEKF